MPLMDLVGHEARGGEQPVGAVHFSSEPERRFRFCEVVDDPERRNGFPH
jgi:hypothetical protein